MLSILDVLAILRGGWPMLRSVLGRYGRTIGRRFRGGFSGVTINDSVSKP
jgi:hypothetical protein